MKRINKSLLSTFIVVFLLGFANNSFSASQRIVINNGPWQLVGDWQEHTGQEQNGVVLLLHKAAGNRSAHKRMASILSDSGYASFRIDLRGHGESTNIRVFDPKVSRFEDPKDPEVTANFSLIKQGYLDIIAAIKWLKEKKEIKGLPFTIIGSSYTGEEMVKAAESTGFADAYIALAPGNFSKSSIEKIDPSGKPWLFVRAEKEMTFIDGIFNDIRAGSKADIWVLSGEGHATDLFEHNANLEEKLTGWLDQNLKK